MSGQEARRRLGAFRREIEDRHDPFFAGAIDQAENDPALAEWWMEQSALDEILSRKLRELAMPAFLRDPLKG